MKSDSFIDLLTEHQGRLYAYVLSLVGHPDNANDVLQETNVVLWKKWEEYEAGTNFRAWAFRVAHFQVLAFRQRCARDRLMFDSDLVSILSAEMKVDDARFSDRADALAACINELAPKQRELLRLRYSVGQSIEHVAANRAMTMASVTQALYRIRQKLIACVARSEWDPGSTVEVSP